MTAFRLSLFYAAYFAMIGIMMPFWPVWLEAKGLTPANIGLVIGSATFVRVFFNPLVAHVADRRGTRQPIMALMAVFAVIFFSFFFVTDNFWPILLVTILFSSCWGAMQPLGESLTMLSAKENGFEYGRVRLWGSLAFIATAIIAGRVLSDTTPDAIMVMIFASVVLMFAVTLFLPNMRTSKATGSSFPIAPLLRNKAFLLVLIAAALIQSSHAVYYGFGTIHWQKSGISDTVIGVLWAEGVIAEVILFSMGAAVLRYTGPMRLIILGGVAGILRWVGTGLDDSLPALFILQALHGLTFGATHLGVIYFISDKVPEELSATALSLYSAVVMGLAMGLMVMASGQLYGVLGGQAYFVVAVMAAIGGLLAFIVRQSNIQIISK
jgi:PPP family 3-phenylpropionic acid transporter